MVGGGCWSSWVAAVAGKMARKWAYAQQRSKQSGGCLAFVGPLVGVLVATHSHGGVRGSWGSRW